MLNDIRIANIFFRVGSISKLFILLWLMSGSSPPMRHKLYGKRNCSLFQHEKRRKVINFLSNYLAINKKFCIHVKIPISHKLSLYLFRISGVKIWGLFEIILLLNFLFLQDIFSIIIRMLTFKQSQNKIKNRQHI